MTNASSSAFQAVTAAATGSVGTARKRSLVSQIAATPDAWERTQIQSGVAACKSLLRKLALAS